MSTVYLAEDIKLPGKLWAVKQFKRFGTEYAFPQGEVSLLMQLNHPYLPHIVDFFPPNPDLPSEFDGSDFGYLVMEYIDGQTLQEWLEQQGTPPSARHTLEIGLQVCDLLHYLHGHEPAPIVYRDLKPANLMLDKQGKIRLIDFGIARSYKPGQSADTVPLGTVAFAAPEQLNRIQTDPRSDLYSLGAMLYYLLSGGSYYAAVLKPLRQLRNGLPELVTDTVHRLLEHDPGDRFQTAAEARSALAQASLLLDVEYPQTPMKPVERHTMCNPPLPPAKPIWTGIGIDLGDTAAALSDAVKKRIVVGALYSGAGATFTTIALARTCSRLGLPTVVIEAAVKEPELAALLGIQTNRVFFDDEDPLVSPTTGYLKDGTRWLARNPSPSAYNPHLPSSTKVNFERIQQMIACSSESNVILDVSDEWLDEEVLQLCRTADEIVVVVDPYPSKWDSDRTRNKLHFLHQIYEEGRSIHWIMNKDAPHARRKERMGSAPAKPLCVLPYVSPELRLHALDKGKLIQDMPPIRETVAIALKPLLKQLQMQPASSKAASSKRQSFWSFF
jgi:eukaryotic-like serine/threonine-protein kinase